MIDPTRTPATASLPKRLWILEILAVVVAVVLFYWPLLDPSRMQSGGDYANLFWPLKEFRLDAMRTAGVLPLWNPHVFMGSALSATMQHAVFYPIDYLFFWRSPTMAALNLYVLFHNVLCGVGVWWLMRRTLDAGATGAILAGAVFPCTAWFWGAQEHINQVATVAWMPWLIGTAILLARGRIGARAFVAAYAMLGVLQFLVGHPQAAFYTHLASAAVLGASVLWAAKGTRLRITLHRGGCFFAAGVLTGLMAALQLLPALEMSGFSYRQFQGSDPSYSLTYSMPPDLLVTYFHAGFFGNYLDGYPDQRAYNEYGLHVGVVTLLLAIAGAVALWSGGRRRWVVFAAVGIVVTLVLALGGNARLTAIASGEFTEFPQPALAQQTFAMEDVHAAEPDSVPGGPSLLALSPHEIMVALIPPARGFRVPARIAILASLAWVLLAGFGADWVVRRVAGRFPAARARTAAVAAATCLVALSWLTLYGATKGEKFRFPKETDGLLAAWRADEALREGRSLDGRLFRLTISDLDLTVAERQRSAELPWEEAFGGNGLDHRWLRLMENNNAVVAFPSVEGYEEGLSPIVRTKDFLFSFNRHFRQERPDPQLMALLGVGTVFSDLPIDTSFYRPRADGARGGHGMLYSVPDSPTAAFWLEQARGIDFAALEGPFYRGGAPHGQRQDALIDYGHAPRWAEDWPRIESDVRNPNEVALASRGEVVGDAVLAMGWMPGWIAVKTGEPLEWLGAVHALVPADAFDGDGVARLAYRPQSFRVGLFLSLMGIGFWSALAMTARRSRLA